MKDRADLIHSLECVPSILTALAESIPQEALDVRRREDFWTVAEHIVHLAEVQPMLLERMERFLAEDHPVFVPYFPDEDEAPSDAPSPMALDAALAQFAQVRSRQMALLKATDAAVWNKRASHPEYEDYGFHILVRHIMMHDHWHMYRVEELWLTRDEYLTDGH